MLRERSFRSRRGGGDGASANGTGDGERSRLSALASVWIGAWSLRGGRGARDFALGGRVQCCRRC